MKVLIYTDCMIFGGSENLIVNLVQNSVLKDQVEWVVSYRGHKVYDREIKRRIGVHCTLNSLPVLSFDTAIYNLALRQIWSPLLLSAKILVKLVKLTGLLDLFNFVLLYVHFRRVRPDVLHINNGGYPGAGSCRIAVCAARFAGLSKIVFTVNNLAYPSKNWLSRLYDRYIGSSVSVFTTASEAAARRLISARDLRASRVEAIPNTVGPAEATSDRASVLRQEFRLDESTFIVGSVGLLTERKGHRYLIEALTRIDSGNTDWVALIFGEGEDAPLLRELIAKAGLEKKIRLVGFRKNVIDYINDFDLMVVPSTANEDFPYVILEAMWLGVPVLGTSIAGIPEQIVEGVTGWVVAPRSTGDLCVFLRKSLEASRIDLKQMGKRGRERYYSHFSEKVVGRKFAELYQSINSRV